MRGTALLVVVLPGVVSAQAPVPDIYRLEEAEFVAQAKQDLRTLKVYADGLRRLQQQLQEQRELFRHRRSIPYSPEQKRTLLSAWGAMFSYVISAEGIRQRYWGFVKVMPPSRAQHAWGFVLTHTALTTELAHGLTFADLAAGNAQLEVLLDEPNPEFGVPARAFAAFKLKVIHAATSTQLLTGDAYRKQLMPQLGKLKLVEAPEGRWALEEMRLNSQVARQKLLRRGVTLFAKNGADVVKDTALAAVFPVQKNVAEFLGDTRVKRIGQPLISAAQLVELIPRLEPGDVIVARQNWFLSNVGLPGFWPHAELYVGTEADLREYFDGDEQVRAWLAQQKPRADSFTRFLELRFPQQWTQFQGNDFQGHAPIRIIESISEGVSFTAAEHGMQVDYLGVMRPRLSKLEKARAIARALGYVGRPYDFDFDFDFFSDASLVCTELVWKSYAPDKELKGLLVPLVDVAGRRTLPANELVKLFDMERELPNRQLDFVAFLDGRESEGRAVFADEEAFRRSHQRLKWDVAQR